MSAQTKILWLSHLIPYPPKGGVLQRSYNLLKQCCEGNQVHLVAFIQRELIETNFTDYAEGLSISQKRLEEFCTSVTFFDIPQERRVFGKYLTGLKGLVTKGGYTIEWLKSRQFDHYIQSLRQEFDLIHFDTISLAPYLADFENIKTVLDHHNIESHMLVRRARNSDSLISRVYYHSEGIKLRAYEKSVCPDFDLNITCSELDSSRLKDLAQCPRVECIPNGVDTEYFKSTRNRSTGVGTPIKLIFAGRLDAYTNQKAAMYIAFTLWPELKRRRDDIEFYLIGAHPPKDIVSAYASDRRFHITGFVDDIRTYLDEADIYICPITDGGGTKLKILDALAMGIPIIAHPVASEGIDTNNEKTILFAEDSSQYLSCIDTLSNKPELYGSIAMESRKLIHDRYSFNKIGERLRNLYASLAHQEN